jgi:hypothetical protein
VYSTLALEGYDLFRPAFAARSVAAHTLDQASPRKPSRRLRVPAPVRYFYQCYARFRFLGARGWWASDPGRPFILKGEGVEHFGIAIGHRALGAVAGHR